MHKNLIKNSYIIILSLALAVSCKDTGSSTSNENQEVNSSEKSNDTNSENISSNDETLICLWQKVGLRDVPGRKGAKYLTTIYFGEQVKFLGEKETASDKKDYVKVELSDGQQGWVYEYLFTGKGKLGIIKEPLPIYKKPDVMDFLGNKFKRGDIIVVLNETKGKWNKIVGLEKKNEGWIQENSTIVYDDLEIKLATLYNRAISEKSQAKRQEKLKLITDNPAFQNSKFIDIVQNAMTNNGDEDFSELDEEISNDQLYITTEVLNVRSNPNSLDDNVIFQLEKGNICDILERGDFETIRENSSYWYRISHDGNEGWIFGYFTSKNN